MEEDAPYVGREQMLVKHFILRQYLSRFARIVLSSLFGAEEMYSSAHYELLRDRYVARLRAIVQGVLEARKRVLYDDLWDLALSQPMTWERDIKNWIRQWIKSGRLEPEGWQPKQRTPHRDKGNLLVWQ